MSNTHTGVILEIRDTKNVSEKFQKRQFVVDQVFVGSYGESHKIGVFSLTQEKCSLIDPFSVGDKVIVHFDLNFRAWIKDNEHQLDRDGEKAYFADVLAWKIEPAEATEQPPQAPAAPSTEQVPPESGAAGQGEDFNGPDDRPF